VVNIPTLDPVTSLRFSVVVDGDNLGTFTSCEGLGAQIEMLEYHEGGQNGFSYKIPGRLTFTPVVLTRPIVGTTGSLAPWFTAFQQKKAGGHTGAITAFDGMGLKVVEWSLVNVFPSRWTGPRFGIDGAGVANETLELTHHGFTQTTGIGSIVG
jgi:phage tail-like protein